MPGAQAAVQAYTDEQLSGAAEAPKAGGVPGGSTSGGHSGGGGLAEADSVTEDVRDALSVPVGL